MGSPISLPCSYGVSTPSLAYSPFPLSFPGFEETKALPSVPPSQPLGWNWGVYKMPHPAKPRECLPWALPELVYEISLLDLSSCLGVHSSQMLFLISGLF